jgi:hypothetical protein
MKKINYLFALIATVFVLGMTSCDTNEVTPDPRVDGIQLSDLDGAWLNYETTYMGETQSTDNGNACFIFNNDNSHMNVTFNSNTGSLTLDYPCNYPDIDEFETVTINDNDEIVLEAFDKVLFQFKILDTSDLQTNKLDIELTYARNSNFIELGTVWHLRK